MARTGARATWAGCLAVWLLVLAGFLAPGVADAAEPEDLSGSWILDPALDWEGILESAVLEAVQGMNFLIRPIAKRRLRKAAVFPMRFDIGYSEGKLTIRSPVSNSAGGWTTDLIRTPLSIESHNGEPIILERWIEDGAVHSFGTSGRGTHLNVFDVEDDGKSFDLRVTITHKRLKRPCTFCLRFLRVL